MDSLRNHRCRLLLSVAFIPVLFLIRSAQAQTDFENVLEQYTATTVNGYMQPLVDLVGANMNAGFYQTAEIPTTGLRISLKLVGMGALVGDDQKTFTLTLPESFSRRTMEAPTLFGGKGTVVRDSSGIEYRPSDGIIDASLFPQAIPQLTVGALYGTELTLRYLPLPSTDAFPGVTLFGLGVRHSVSQYLPDLPFDLAGGFFYSNYNAGDILSVTAVSFGAQASKSLALLTVYGGIAWEKSTMNISYTPTQSGFPPVDIDLDGDNTIRLTAGGALSLGVLSLFVDANVGSVTNFSGGIGFGF